MARFLIGTIPVIGHVAPMQPIAQQLVGRGHQVWWYTGELFRDRITDLGARFVPMSAGFDYSVTENVPAALSQARESLKGLAQLKFDLKTFFIEPAVGNAQDLRKILEEFPADALIADSFFLAASWVHELGGPPWAQLGISALSLPSKDTAPFGLGLPPSRSVQGRLKNRALSALSKGVFRDVLGAVNQARAQVDLPATDKVLFDTVSPYLYLAGTVPGFEYPRSDLPPQVHFIGPQFLSVAADFTPPAWWDEVTQAQTVVLVTQGTVTTDPQSLIIPTIQALEAEDVLVVATTGKPPTESLSSLKLPANAKVAQFIPYPNLLPHVDVMVTNGGYNGVQMALAQGIPLVAAGKSEDKPEVCARVAWSGVGVDLKSASPKPEQIRQAVRQVLTDERYRQNARRLQAEIEQYREANAAGLLEQLADTRQPVYELAPVDAV